MDFLACDKRCCKLHYLNCFAEKLSEPAGAANDEQATQMDGSYQANNNSGPGNPSFYPLTQPFLDRAVTQAGVSADSPGSTTPFVGAQKSIRCKNLVINQLMLY